MNARGSCSGSVALPFPSGFCTHAFGVQALPWPALSPAALDLDGGARW